MTKKYDSKITGKRIAELRKESSLTQENLASDLHIDSSLIGHYERGRKISIDMLCEIAKYFKTSTDYLLGLTNCRKPKNDYRALCDDIGIDDTAVETLKDINFVYDGQYLIPTLNFLIKQELLPPDEAFFEEQYNKIENTKTTDKEKKKAIRRLHSLYDRIYKKWEDKNCQPILSRIEDYFVAKTEDVNLCLTLSGELKKEEEITNEIEKLHIRKKIPKQKLLEEAHFEEISDSLKKGKTKFLKEVDRK